MAVTHLMYGRFQEGQYSATADRRIDWVTDTVKSTLHTVTYTFDQDAHTYFSSASNELATAGGYTAGGVALGGKALTYDTGTNEVRLDANDASWAGATFTARHCIQWKDGPGAAAADPLISDVNFGADESVAAGTFTVQWDATGVAKITVSPT